MSYTFRGFYIPERMMDGLHRYVNEGVQPGGFLTAVICNDLEGAVGKADDENMANLPAYVGWLYNKAPIGCHGSRQAMERWIKHKQGERNERDHSNDAA